MNNVKRQARTQSELLTLLTNLFIPRGKNETVRPESIKHKLAPYTRSENRHFRKQ